MNDIRTNYIKTTDTVNISSTIEDSCGISQKELFIKLISEYIIHLQKLRFTPFSIQSYKGDALGFLSFIDQNSISIYDIEQDTLVQYRKYLSEIKKEKDSSVRRKMLGIRKFFSFLEEKNFISKVHLDQVAIPVRQEVLPQDLKTKSIDNIIESLDYSTLSLKDARNNAIFLLLSIEGLKTNEIINLKWNDFIIGSEVSTLNILGSKPRIIELYKDTTLTLEKYKSILVHNLEQLPENMFVCLKSRSFTIYENLSRDGIKFIIKEFSKKYSTKLNTELLRHHAISWMLDKGYGLVDIKRHLGLKRDGNISKHIVLRKKLALNQK